MKGFLGAAFAGAVLCASPAVFAGCPNPCEMRVSAVQVEPPLSCGTVKVNAQDCDCSVWFSIQNGCKQSIDATAFSWDSCFPSNTSPCTSIQPGQEGILKPPLTTTGHRDYSFAVSDAEGVHTITFTSDVASFDTGCAIRAAGTSPQPIWLAALGLVAFALTWRARSRF
jgi:MYXO-CTERM domain-containing protein